MNDAHVGPFAFGEFVQTGDSGVEVIGEKEAQTVWNAERIVGRAGLIVRNSTDEKGRSRLRPIMRFHRREFGHSLLENSSRPATLASKSSARRKLKPYGMRAHSRSCGSHRSEF